MTSSPELNCYSRMNNFIGMPACSAYGCTIKYCFVSLRCSIFNKNSSGDEIANVNFYDDMARTYFKILKKRTYFV